MASQPPPLRERIGLSPVWEKWFSEVLIPAIVNLENDALGSSLSPIDDGRTGGLLKRVEDLEFFIQAVC